MSSVNLISVIIPTRNSVNYICEAINSVLAQTYQDYEIIIVDDGSTDNTKEVLNQYNNKIRYFYQKNRGASAARNLGIQHAQGKFTAFLDADDIWLPFKLQSQIDIMNSNPDTALMFTDIDSFDQNGIVRHSLLRSQFPQKKETFKYKVLKMNTDDGSIIKDNFYKELIYGNLIFTPTVLINSKYLDNGKYFDESLFISEDYDAWLRIAQKYPILYFNKVTTRCRLTSNSLSGDLKIRSLNYRKSDGKMFEKHLKTCPNEFKALIRERICNSYRIAAHGYLDIDNRTEARKLSYLSLIYNKFQFKLYIYILISFFPFSLISFVKKIRLMLWQKSA